MIKSFSYRSVAGSLFNDMDRWACISKPRYITSPFWFRKVRGKVFVGLYKKTKLPYFKRVSNTKLKCSKNAAIRGLDILKAILNIDHHYHFCDYDVLYLWFRLSTFGFRVFRKSLQHMVIKKLILQKEDMPKISRRDHSHTIITFRSNNTRPVGRYEKREDVYTSRESGFFPFTLELGGPQPWRLRFKA